MAQDNLEGLLEKLQGVLGDEESVQLSKQEIERTRQMIKAYDMILGLGRLGRVLVWIALSIAGLVTAYEQIFKSGGGQ